MTNTHQACHTNKGRVFKLAHFVRPFRSVGSAWPFIRDMAIQQFTPRRRRKIDRATDGIAIATIVAIVILTISQQHLASAASPSKVATTPYGGTIRSKI
ncbi:unnamed protein product [Nesidiocoris tenuis]|uniref:Uncharacterized protein n=1 Tax=Nesidiocoris tenuis TaxID=355587 RepID=A0A6H5GMH4_9HEMI|nr:unnamed protein product [Nesidiocoris tenuis]